MRPSRCEERDPSTSSGRYRGLSREGCCFEGIAPAGDSTTELPIRFALRFSEEPKVAVPVHELHAERPECDGRKAMLPLGTPDKQKPCSLALLPPTQPRRSCVR